MRIVSLLIVLFVFISGTSYSSVPKDDKKKVEGGTDQLVEPVYVEGIVYALPRTALLINITAQKIAFKPGPYFQYAQKYLGVNNAKGTAEVKWNISSIAINNYSEADPNAMFKAMDTVASRLALLSNGVIAGVNTNGVESSDINIGADFISNNDPKIEESTDLSSDEFYEILVDPETGIESMLIKSLEVKAREAADYIIRLRKKRAFSILSPSDVIPEDGLGYEVFVKEAQRLDKEYMALFVGKESVSYHDFSFVFIPENVNIKNEVLFRFSENKGILPKSDITGKPIFLSLEKEPKAISVLKNLKSSDNPNAGESGLFYRVPVTAEITISNGLETLYSGRTIVSQYGEILPVPENLLNGYYQIRYNTGTGSIKSILEKK